MRTLKSRRRAARHPLTRLCDDVSEVINRVRKAFGHLPMKTAAGAPQIRVAEETIEQIAAQLGRGEQSRAAWHTALADYEAAWMAALKDLKQAQRRRAA